MGEGAGPRAPWLTRRIEPLVAGLLGGLLAGLHGVSTRLVGACGLDRSLVWAAAFGRLHHVLRGPRVARVRAALADALPEVPEVERERIVRGVFVSLYQGLVELLALGGRERARLLARVEVEGLEEVEAAARTSGSGGVLVVTAHLGNWELACAKVASLGQPVAVVYRPLALPALDRALGSLRARGGGPEDGSLGVPVEQIARGRAGLAVVRALEAGKRLLVLLDQNAGRAEGVFVPFFGRPASTRAAPIALAVERGIPVVPAFIYREAGGGRHRVVIEPALALERGDPGDPAALLRNVGRVTAAIEAAIRRAPEQWIWVHSRWRTQPRSGEGSSTGADGGAGRDRGSIAGARERV